MGMSSGGLRVCRAMAAFSSISCSYSLDVIARPPSFSNLSRCHFYPLLLSSPSRRSISGIATARCQSESSMIKEMLAEQEESSDSELDTRSIHDIEEEQEEEDQYEENDYWDDVDYPAATHLASNIARLKRTQVSLVVPEVRKWIKEGNLATKHTFLFVIRKLKKRNRHVHAVKIANWMAAKKPVPHEIKDDIRRVELHGRCGWYQMAERIFQKLPDEHKKEEAYNALLLAYTKSKMLRKAEVVYEKLRDEKMITTPYTFNLMATLYRRRGLEEKVLNLADEARELGIQLDMCSENILLSAKYKVEGIESAEQAFQGIKSSRHEKAHISTYVTMASCYASDELFDKALAVLQTIEHGMEIGQFPKLRTAYNTLITMYATVKNPAGVQRAWKELLKLGDPISQDFICVIKSWGKLGEVERAERLFKDAESLGKLGSSPMFSAMLYVYSILGLTARAEELVRRMKEELGVQMDPWCYFHLVDMYLKAGNTEEAITWLRESQVTGTRNPRSRPLPASLTLVLGALAAIPDVERAEQILEDWKLAGYWVNSAVYNKLLLAYVNAKRPAYGFVERMLQDGARPNAKTDILFSELRKMKSGDKSEAQATEAL
ncbi:pentatricopeptide repeat-containing protein At1g80270, mitochondrial-like [Selaginella moellendorffii]|uniref:pentatricopeptide repeat-containing protein At1g80270, mitochondrial-like n=1 Tax=Selaginella moellendorffii TaxID=88036 RepID=UPI000D1CCF17|nr:pentatricopeptide repeat-containing protein At1g80270, mitochondrial-like [Selaginella moellendorffii]|eukprot:XP_024541760.1 pentatricopeptide repeat-containing protein At1g80270, mitochondrial-like [Selaginella moellendorffii]